MTFCLITMNTPYAQIPKKIAIQVKKTRAPKKYFTLSRSPKLAKVITLRTIGITAFSEIPSIKADMYFGGRIPAKPTILLFRIAMQTPKLIITATERLKAISLGRYYTMSGSIRHRAPLSMKQTKILVLRAIEF